MKLHCHATHVGNEEFVHRRKEFAWDFVVNQSSVKFLTSSTQFSTRRALNGNGVDVIPTFHFDLLKKKETNKQNRKTNLTPYNCNQIEQI